MKSFRARAPGLNQAYIARIYVNAPLSFRCTRKPALDWGGEQADELLNSSRCPSLELTPRPPTTHRGTHPGSGGSSDTDGAIARLVQGLQSGSPTATSTFRGEGERGRLAGGVSAKALTHSSTGDDEVKVPPGAEKFQGPAAPAAPAPSHSRDWELEARIPKQGGTGGSFRIDDESPEID